MGYNVHITRQQNWLLHEVTQEISMQEWKTYLSSDPEMRLDNFAEATTNSGDTIRIDKDGLSVWTAYSGDGLDGNHAWFDYHKGSIVVKNPDDEIIQKMIRIADSINADLQGDDGEYYLQRMKATTKNAAIEISFTPEKTIQRTAKPWWKRWSVF